MKNYTRKKNRNNKTRKNQNKKNKKVFTYKHFNSGEGMLTAVWGPSLWHYLHAISFNYPCNPTSQDKKYYKQFLTNLKYTLPCKYCRINLSKNFKSLPLSSCVFTNRHTFSKYVYLLHEHINKMLGKKSGLSYCDVRDRYENFRSRCVIDKPKIFNYSKFKKEKGCTTPMYGEKSKCLIKIVPQKSRCKTLTIDKKCLKTKIL